MTYKSHKPETLAIRRRFEGRVPPTVAERLPGLIETAQAGQEEIAMEGLCSSQRRRRRIHRGARPT